VLQFDNALLREADKTARLMGLNLKAAVEMPRKFANPMSVKRLCRKQLSPKR
jgi:hypothetical protein